MRHWLKVFLALASPVITAWARMDPPAPDADCGSQLKTGLSEYKLQHLDAAAVALNSALQCDPKMIDARLLLGHVYAQKGDETKALRAYMLVLGQEASNTDALRGAAAIYLHNDNNEKAVPLLEVLARLEPGNAQAQVDLGASYAASGRPSEAEGHFREAIRLDANNASALTGLGNLCQKQGKTEEAKALLKQAIKLAPDAFEPRFVLGSIRNGEGRYAEAASELETSLKLGGSESAEVYYQLARAYQNLGRGAERRQALARYAQISQDAAKQKEIRNAGFVLISEARTLVNAGDLKGAADKLEEASKMGQPDDELLFRLAGLQYDLRRYDEARSNVRKAIELAPGVWVYHFLLGLISMDRHLLPEARDSLALAIHLNPTAAEAYNALGELDMQQKEFQGAITHFKRAVELDPKQATYEANLETAKRSSQ